MTDQPAARFNRATQSVCRALCNGAGRESAAEVVAGESLATFETWVRFTLAEHGLAGQLNETDFARLQRLMGHR